MKKLLSILLCFLMIMGVTACGVDETAGNSSLDVTSEESSSDESEISSNEDTSSYETSSDKKNTTSNKNSSGKNKGSSSQKQSEDFKETSSVKRYPTKQKAIQVRRANQTWFKKVGRCDVSGYSGIGLNWSCASVEFDVDCTDDLALEFVKGGGNNPVYVEIYVDGKIIADRTKIEASGTIDIAEDLKPGVHRVKIVRQSDAECPSITLTKVYAYGQLISKAPENKPLYIEAIGDASLIGWGVRLEDSFYTDFSANSGTKQPIARNRENEDGTLAYTYVAAEKLNADTYTLAKQGAGVAATYHKTKAKVNGTDTVVGNARGGLLPTMYDYSLPSGSNKYEPTRLPDVIVIDAGSADLSKSCQDTVLDGDKLGIDTARAVGIAVSFLEKLRDLNPNAKIIWCYGLTNGESVAKYVNEVVTAAGGAKKGFYTLKLPTSERSGYPSAKEYAAAADLLVNKIKQLIK